MKKLFISVFLLLLILTVNVSAKTVTATIPDYSFILGDASIYYQDSEYPLLSYKNVTYFPMTFDYCRALNLITSWDNEKGLYIAYQPDFNYAKESLPIYPTAANKKYNKATVCEYSIYINGKLFDNKSATYPFLNFKGVTYCPMTWDLAYNEFGWNISFVPGQFSVSISRTKTTNYNLAYSLSDGFVVYRYVWEPIVLENGVEANVSKPYYEKFDYATQSLVPYPEGSGTPVRQYVRHEVEIKDGLFYLNSKAIPDCKPYSGMISESAYVLEYSLAEKSFYELNYSYTEGSYNGKISYTFCDVYGDLKFIGENVYIPTAVKCADGNVYFGTNAQARSFAESIVRSAVHKLYRLSPGGEITLINDLFPQYGSMELLGEVNGIMYLNCLYMPCYDPVTRMVYEPYPLNDGYFTYNGNDLVKLYNYQYTDRSVLAPTGEIYGIFNRTGQIKRIN